MPARQVAGGDKVFAAGQDIGCMRGGLRETAGRRRGTGNYGAGHQSKTVLIPRPGPRYCWQSTWQEGDDAYAAVKSAITERYLRSPKASFVYSVSGLSAKAPQPAPATQ